MSDQDIPAIETGAKGRLYDDKATQTIRGTRTNERTAEERVEQARKNALWWRRELDQGRRGLLADVEWLLRDLERAGGLR